MEQDDFYTMMTISLEQAKNGDTIPFEEAMDKLMKQLEFIERD